MNEWMNDYKKKLKVFLGDYGKVLLVSILLCVSLLSVCLIVTSLSPHTLRVSFLDIGQGDAILIQTPSGHDMLVDGGGSDRVLEKISKQMSYFDRHIDVMVATHPDADHVTGLIPVLQNYEVSHIITSPLSGHTGISEVLTKNIIDEHAVVHVAKAGDEINFGDV